MEGEDRYGVLYVGGDIPGFKVPSISSYLADDAFYFKKFIVVADSLERLIKELYKAGQDPLNRYFLMIDEIDSYQYDISYRPVLANVIDIYFFFKKQLRCMVSATVGSFSNPLIEQEPVIEAEFNSPAPREITLVDTLSCPVTVANKIRELKQKHPDDKILVAYNSIRRGILPTIELLPEEERGECAVLCSGKSKNYVQQYYTELLDNTLEKRINFMTCTYFVGVDIYEKYHLISVSDAEVPHSLLSVDKLQQIAERFRLDKGVLSETIVYSYMVPRDVNVSESDIKNQMLADADLLLDFVNNNEKISATFSRMFKPSQVITTKEIIERGEKRYCYLKPFRLIREDIDGELVRAYLNIDCALLSLKLLRTIYLSKDGLPNELIADGHNINQFSDNIDNEDILKVNNAREKVDEMAFLANEEELARIIEELRAYPSAEAMERDEITLSSKHSTYGAIFIERFIELHKYVPFDVLAEKLPKYDYEEDYEEFKNSIIYWALDESHNFKVGINASFPLNSRHTGDEITEKMQNILCSNFDIRRDQAGKKTCLAILRLFCNYRRIRTREDARPNLYKIRSYDVNGFNCEPLNRIEAGVSVRRLFDFEF